MSVDYVVLAKDNLERMSTWTGMTHGELEEILDNCEKIGSVQVFWVIRNRWFGLRVDGMYVYNGLLDVVMKEAIGRTR